MSNQTATLVKYTLVDGTRGSIEYDHVLYLDARKDLDIVNQAVDSLTADGEVGFEITEIKATSPANYTGYKGAQF